MKNLDLLTDQRAAVGGSVEARRWLRMLDLFCGGGGTSAGAMEAAEWMGYAPRVIGVNHWDRACETWMLNHPEQPRPLCTGVDSINPRDLYQRGELDLLWASPECTNHSPARGDAEINDQSRATAWCMLKYMDALSPDVVLMENVPQFRNYGPRLRVRKRMPDGRIKRVWRHDPRRRGETFKAICTGMASLGYKVDHTILCAADYGDPTSRSRLFIQAVRGRRRIVWPTPTHGEGRLPWVPAREIIDWSLATPSIYNRARPLSPKTMRRIWEGLQRFGFAPFMAQLQGTSDSHLRATALSVEGPVPAVTAKGTHTALAQPFLICMEHKGSVRSIDRPMPVVTTANGGAIGLAQPCLLPQGGGGVMRPVSQPCPTVATDGAIALVEPFLVKYYGTGKGASIHKPLDTVTARDRFALCKPMIVEIGPDRYMLDIGFRMLKAPELALAQGFRRDYRFSGNQSEAVAQIGNAVPRRLARAIVAAAWGQKADVSGLLALP